MKFISFLLLMMFMADCASPSKSSYRSEPSPGSAKEGVYSKIVKGSGRAGKTAINKGSSALSEIQCTEAARMNAMASAYPGRTNFSGVTVIECRETSENFASCECDIGFRN
ncbi:MAG TPA: hypothetical protein PL048_13930 [Leptospiraceae bacterium]|nr:hypothetical protein [Leptospiraceae bacterium]HNO23865.1 hypothetical protein [Leptospiraceae bacterium]